jgi:L-rhamnonate dehydratase
LKIAAYATVHDLIVIPHGHSTPMSIHFAAAQSPIHSPYQEYLVKWNAIHMHFLKNPLWPVDGSIAVPSAAGANMDLDSAKIEREEDVRV